MGNDEQGEILAEAIDGLHDGLLGFIVQRTSGFIKDDDIGLLIQGASDTNTLALTAREADATLTDKGLISLGPALYAVSNLCLLCSQLNTLMIDPVFRHAKGDVLFDAAVG